jgi:hypothetical protein
MTVQVAATSPSTKTPQSEQRQATRCPCACPKHPKGSQSPLGLHQRAHTSRTAHRRCRGSLDDRSCQSLERADRPRLRCDAAGTEPEQAKEAPSLHTSNLLMQPSSQHSMLSLRLHMSPGPHDFSFCFCSLSTCSSSVRKLLKTKPHISTMGAQELRHTGSFSFTAGQQHCRVNLHSMGRFTSFCSSSKEKDHKHLPSRETITTAINILAVCSPNCTLYGDEASKGYHVGNTLYYHINSQSTKRAAAGPFITGQRSCNHIETRTTNQSTKRRPATLSASAIDSKESGGLPS